MSDAGLRYESHEYAIPIAGMTLRVLGPKHPHALNRDRQVIERSEQDGYKPHWAVPWPAAVMLAECVVQHVEPGIDSILELGAGLGIAGLALAMAGHRVVITDYDEDALAFVRASAELNGVTLAGVHPLDWRHPPAEQYAVIIGSEIAYDRSHHEPIAALLKACLRPGGQAFVSDLNRDGAEAFPDAVRSAGFLCEILPATARAIPAFDSLDHRVFKGRIFRIFRPL